MVNKKLLSWGLILVVALLFVWMCAQHFLEGDGVEYGFMVPSDAANNDYRKISNIGDIIESQITHYRTVNGRFLLHCIVQAFCGILGQKCFALCNGLVFILFVIGFMRLTELKIEKFSNTVCAVFMGWLLYFPMRFDPAYQIGYLWTGTVILWWLILWWKNKAEYSRLYIALLAVISLVVGSLHEAFSIPLCGSMVVYWLICRMHYSAKQWSMAIGFAAGALIEILAPGNYLRVEAFASPTLLEALFVYLISIPPLWCFVMLCCCGIPVKFWKTTSFYWSGVICGSVALIFVGITYGYALQGIALLIAIMCGIVWKNYGKEWKRSSLSIIALLIIAIFSIAREKEEKILREKYKYIYNAYMKSADGVVWVPDNLYGPEYRHAEILSRPYMWIRGCKNTEKPPMLKLYPMSMKRHVDKVEASAMYQLSPQAWLMFSSKNHPQQYVLKRYILGVPAGQRLIDFSNAGFDSLSSSSSWNAAVYANEKYPWMKVEINFVE